MKVKPFRILLAALFLLAGCLAGPQGTKGASGPGVTSDPKAVPLGPSEQGPSPNPTEDPSHDTPPVAFPGECSADLWVDALVSLEDWHPIVEKDLTLELKVKNQDGEEEPLDRLSWKVDVSGSPFPAEEGHSYSHRISFKLGLTPLLRELSKMKTCEEEIKWMRDKKYVLLGSYGDELAKLYTGRREFSLSVDSRTTDLGDFILDAVVLEASPLPPTEMIFKEPPAPKRPTFKRLPLDRR